MNWNLRIAEGACCCSEFDFRISSSSYWLDARGRQITICLYCTVKDSVSEDVKSAVVSGYSFVVQFAQVQGTT
jgi:hypothetical protein